MSDDEPAVVQYEVTDQTVKEFPDFGPELLALTAQLIDGPVETVRVLDAPKSRIPAAKVPEFYEDLTPPEEYERVRIARMQTEHRDAGIGRPTKRDRRQIDYLKDFLQQ